ncbi:MULTISPECIES: NUDIX domain-containing protein [Streptomyces]|uniref:8-oxo-dGTP diphosphatase n=1 Tax=Streptomyces harbinensis TaxID=1176198 RepID=A0A1I6WAH7_9ACTN|nr:MULTISPECIES: NUDIX hydrolase [Streptomyces]SFT22995.1 8-oxo-dGTP diphosphatase [Streptomyces harbinensis]
MSDENIETIRYTADIVLVAEGHVLLIERDWPPFEGRWALPGGHVDPGETSLQAAVRELLEETGIEVLPAELRHIGRWDAPGRDPRGRYATDAYVAVRPERDTPTAGTDARAARWWPLPALPPLAFDHDRIVAAITR